MLCRAGDAQGEGCAARARVAPGGSLMLSGGSDEESFVSRLRVARLDVAAAFFCFFSFIRASAVFTDCLKILILCDGNRACSGCKSQLKFDSVCRFTRRGACDGSLPREQESPRIK